MLAMLVACCCLASAVAGEAFGYGIWFDASENNIEGLGLGLPVIGNNSTEGASLALCGNNVKRMEGFQFAFLGFNYAKSMEGAQLAFVNMLEGQHGDFALQWGFYNQSAKNGVQIGFLNNAQDNATFQLGLININKNGFFPIMIFVNFGKNLFD